MATVKALIRYSDTGKIEECRTADVLANTTGGGGSGSDTFAFFVAS